MSGRLLFHQARSPDQPGTLAALLCRAGSCPEATSHGLRFLDRRERERFVSWAEVLSSSQKVAAGLDALGVICGDRVALLFHTEPGFFEAFFGATLLGAVPVPLAPPVRLGNRQLFLDRLKAQLEACRPRAILASPEVKRFLIGFGDGQFESGLRAPLEIGELPACPPSAAGEGLTQADKNARGHGDAASLGLIQFSSGTTSSPKPIALAHRALLFQAQLLSRFWPEPEDASAPRQAGVSWLPLHHDMGLIGCVLPALLRVADLTLMPPELFVARPASWLRAISRARATVSPAPNFGYASCVDRIRDDELVGVDLGSWSAALNGSETVSPTVLRRFSERFARWGLRPEAVTPVYGLAEASLAVTVSALERRFETASFDRVALANGSATICQGGSSAPSSELVSLGPPVPGFQLQVRGGSGELLPSRRVGRVWIRGPSLMEGYFGLEAATTEVLCEGWLDTGDLGFVHQGALFFCGREKDILVLQGQNWAPEPVERAALDSLETRVARQASSSLSGAVAVSLLPERASVEELWVLLERLRGAVGSTAELVDACRKAVIVETGLRPDRVLIVEHGALPRTSSGKMRRRAALEAFLAGALQVEAAV